MAKKVNPNIVPQGISKLPGIAITFLDRYSWRSCGLSPEDETNYAQDIVTWSLEPGALQFNQFYRLKGINEELWAEWKKNSSLLKRAHEEARRNLGERRERLAIYARKEGVNAETIHFTLHKYDSIWAEVIAEKKALEKELLELRAQLANKESEKAQVTVVEIPNFSLTPEEVAQKAHNATAKFKKAKYDTVQRGKSESNDVGRRKKSTNDDEDNVSDE